MASYFCCLYSSCMPSNTQVMKKMTTQSKSADLHQFFILLKFASQICLCLKLGPSWLIYHFWGNRQAQEIYFEFECISLRFQKVISIRHQELHEAHQALGACPTKYVVLVKYYILIYVQKINNLGMNKTTTRQKRGKPMDRVLLLITYGQFCAYFNKLKETTSRICDIF